MQPVDPGDLAQGVGGDEDHHEADGAAGPVARRAWRMSAHNQGPAPPGQPPSSSLNPRALEIQSEVCSEHRSVVTEAGGPPAKPAPRGGSPSICHGPRRERPPPEWLPHAPAHPRRVRLVPSKAGGTWPSAGCDSRGPSRAAPAQPPTPGLVRHLSASDREPVRVVHRNGAAGGHCCHPTVASSWSSRGPSEFSGTCSPPRAIPAPRRWPGSVSLTLCGV